MQSFRDILEQIENASLDSAEKGRRFEVLMQSYLATEPLYADDFEEIWLWNDYPGRAGRPDTGIDLVAKTKDGELAAIQCKFYAPGTRIKKEHVDGFIVASGKKNEFQRRIFISTSDNWGPNAEDTVHGHDPEVERLRAQDLDNSSIDWSRFSLENPGTLIRKKKLTPRPYQREAINDVVEAFKGSDRGKLIMACGTGKTFTSLKLAEEFVPEGGAVLFMVPSISLLSQTVREWAAAADRPQHRYAVCSDVKVGKRKKSDSEDISVTDLAFPATTDGERLAHKYAERQRSEEDMTVVFSTYQSIQAIDAAQKIDGGLPEFDLIICDEAHRTTGVTLKGDDDSAFVQIHDDKNVSGKKRLYMTATPRVYGDTAAAKALEAGAFLADMNNVEQYGETFHTLSFAKAVEMEILTDYKVLVLAVDEGHVSRRFQGFLADNAGEINMEDAAKLIGCWNGLAKRANPDFPDEFLTDPEPMRRAVAFAGTIPASKQISASFNQIVEEEANNLAPEGGMELGLEVRHVDGTFNVMKRNEQLDWLKADPGEGECRILSNVKCLSEGVDVPALDSVLFLAPRKSQVDVVQSVGRVMRRPPDGSKKYGYVILPIAIPADQEPEHALADNERYRVVWQVLQALRSHDDRLDAEINKIKLAKTNSTRISVVGIGGKADEDESREGSDPADNDSTRQLTWAFDGVEEWRDAIFSRIVEKVGDRQYWENWAKDIAKISQSYITRIRALVDRGEGRLRESFDGFLTGLQNNLNPQVDENQAIEMLAQHLITRPVFDALFEDYSFTDSNPVSISMQHMLDLLDLEGVDSGQEELQAFYRSVRMRAEGIHDAAAKQGIVKDLYETFFQTAFKDMAERLGIVYTPIEVVDFILQSADEALRDHFGKGVTDEGVHVLDPFTGTGTFIVRLIQSGLISGDDLERKFHSELHANEIVLLAYYVAAVNIEEAFHGENGGEYSPFEGIVLTDTFQMHEDDDQDELPGMERFPENNERVKRQKELPIRVIVGNPPYSAGQSSANDQNQNLKYPHLDKRIETTYAENSTAQLKTSLYDSYIRAIRLASDRIGERGVVCFVSNGGFLDSNTADGLRKSLVDEFSEIRIFNLRGNARGSGELRRKEKGNVFGAGSRTTIAITLLIRDPDSAAKGTIRYRDIGDYLTREQKLSEISLAGSFGGLEMTTIEPNAFGDWLTQRSEDFPAFDPVAPEGNASSIFKETGHGLKTNRDIWVYDSSVPALVEKVSALIAEYNIAAGLFRGGSSPSEVSLNMNPAEIAWSSKLKRLAESGRPLRFEKSSVRRAMYRPFQMQHVYFDRDLNERTSNLAKYFPADGVPQIAISVIAPGESAQFSVLATSVIPDFHLLASAKVFPRYTYVEGGADNLIDAAEEDQGPDGRIDNITDETLRRFQVTYGNDITKDQIFFYIYGLLHSPEYRDQFQGDLKKMLPRIPKVTSFDEFRTAGERLAELHLGYELLDPWPLNIQEPMEPDFTVQKMRFAKNGKEKDRTTIVFNDQITISGIPLEAYRYHLGARSAIDWVIERYQVRPEPKSGITNDPNSWGEEADDPRYILDLVGRVVRVSMETMEIVDLLPPIEIVAENT